MASLSGQATLFGETVSVTLELADDKATKWLEDYIFARGYNDPTLGLTVEQQALKALADAGKMWRNVAQQKAERELNVANRAARKALLEDPVWDSGIVLP